MSTQLETPDKGEIVKFFLDHADDLQDKTLQIKSKNGEFLAELYSTKEPSI